MCSQDSVEEGVGGDDGMSDRPYVSPCRVCVNGKLSCWYIACVAGDVIRCSNHTRHADPHELMPLDEEMYFGGYARTRTEV